MSESSLLAKVMLKIGALKHVRIFRNNTGMGWQGRGGRQPDGTVVLRDARPIHAGLIKGSSDLVGWTTIIITADMIGKPVAIFTAIETKKKGGKSASDEQLTFIQNVKTAGGIAAQVRSEDEASAIISAGIS